MANFGKIKLDKIVTVYCLDMEEEIKSGKWR